MGLSYAPHPYKKNVWVLSVDEREWREVHAWLFKQADLRGLSEAGFFSAECRVAKNLALRKLAQRSYSSHEMSKLLEKYLVSPETIERVVNECVELGYIDDDDWICGFIRRCEAKNLSRRAICQKLQGKGVPTENLKSKTSEKEIVRKLLETKYRKYDLNDPKQKQKVIGALIRRGFTYDDILFEGEA